jgi:rare lipoprotein A (peptidoglycan hydrolase)
MFKFIALAAFSLAASSVCALVVPRSTPPAGWPTDLLEPYDTYHARYMALQCNLKHNTPFFDSCCHPLLATESLATARPAQCNPSVNPSTAAAAPTASPAADPQDDDEDDYCDDGDDELPSSSSAPLAPAVTTAYVPTTTPVNVPEPKTTTPAAAPAATQAPASNVNTGGFATYFYQNGVAGACGTVHSDNDMIAAIDGDRYGDLSARSALCGKQVRLTNTKNQKSVTVTIADACPTCDNSNSIDLSKGAFEQIATLDEGIVPITWSFV